MTHEEIKKAFETFKKELKKETGISGGFVMNFKQIQNRTATYCIISNAMSFERSIAYDKEVDEMVQGFESWSAEAKAKSHEDTMKRIERTRRLLAEYGNKLNYAKAKAKTITNSKAFAKFQETVGKTRTCIEEANSCYYLRFNY